MLFHVLLTAVVAVTVSVVHGSQLWCHQGGKGVWGPAQCGEGTTECYKFLCDFENPKKYDVPFETRGCGVEASKGLANESCFQAMGACQYLGGISTCFTCRNRHMCNSETRSSPTCALLLVFGIIRLVLY